jgi:hypothetical protein
MQVTNNSNVLTMLKITSNIDIKLKFLNLGKRWGKRSL